MNIMLSSLVWAIIILIPLSLKWQIDRKIGFITGIVIGLFTGIIVNSISAVSGDLSIVALLGLELLFIISIMMFLIILRFYRDPERIPLSAEKIIISPADGKIKYVTVIENGEIPFSIKGNRRSKLLELARTDLLDNGAFLIGISMSILDVHVNRAPIAGKIMLQQPMKGKFLSLKTRAALFVNERVTTVIDNGQFKIGVIQIASRMVRRIISYLHEGDSVTIAQRIGMIKFGSQVDLVIPRLNNLKITVQPNDKVIAGISGIAEYK